MTWNNNNAEELMSTYDWLCTVNCHCLRCPASSASKCELYNNVCLNFFGFSCAAIISSTEMCIFDHYHLILCIVPSFKPFCIVKCQDKTTYICLWKFAKIHLLFFLCPSAQLANCGMDFHENLLWEVTLKFVGTFQDLVKIVLQQ
jgi:hypothetical protein